MRYNVSALVSPHLEGLKASKYYTDSEPSARNIIHIFFDKVVIIRNS